MKGNNRGRKWIRGEIERLDPVADYERIFSLIVSQLTPQSAVGLNLFYTVGFLRQAAPPAAAKPVDRAGRGMVYTQGDRRADETSKHFVDWAYHGPSSERGRAAIAAVKRMHDVIACDWEFPSHAFIHGTASFALQLDRLFRVVGAEGFTKKEQIAQVMFWHDVAVQLGVSNVPESWEEMNQYLDEYEANSELFGYSPEGARLAEGLLGQFTDRWFPSRLRLLGRWLVLSLCEPHILAALRLSPPPRLFAGLVHLVARASIYARRHLLADPSGPVDLSAFIPDHGGLTQTGNRGAAAAY
jgi:hypothetical protein